MELKYHNQIFNVKSELSGDVISSEINSEKQTMRARQISANIYNVSIANKYSNAYIARDNGKIYVNIAGNSFTFEEVQEEERTFDVSGGASADKELIKPPMPGSIVKVIAEKGQKVEEGDPLIIIEAMKMETTLYSTISGCVTEVNCSAGEQVDSDRILIIIEKEKQ